MYTRRMVHSTDRLATLLSHVEVWHVRIRSRESRVPTHPYQTQHLSYCTIYCIMYVVCLLKRGPFIHKHRGLDQWSPFLLWVNITRNKQITWYIIIETLITYENIFITSKYSGKYINNIFILVSATCIEVMYSQHVWELLEIRMYKDMKTWSTNPIGWSQRCLKENR